MTFEILSFQTLLQNFFLQRLMQQRNVSTETLHSYRDTFRIFILFICSTFNKAATEVKIDDFSLDKLEKFCLYLKEVRKNKPVTINNRIAAIKSFMHYVSEMAPEYSFIAKRALMLPAQKHEAPAMDFITKKEFDSMIAACDTRTFLGARDKLMLILLYNTGARVSELLCMKRCDIHRTESTGIASLRIYGKGRKQREVPLWKTTIRYIDRFLHDHPTDEHGFLFMNKNGDRLTRSGVRTRIDVITEKASLTSKSLLEKNITPHTFRHSVAMNLLNSGVDISTIAIWLGHSSIETTHKYMVADLEIKRKAMEKAGLAVNGAYRYRPSKDLLGFLNSL